MPNESVASSDQQAAATPRLRWGRIAVIAAATTAALAALLVGTAFAICIPTPYSVTASATPAIATWTDTSGLWVPSGGFPGCASGDSAADTTATPTTIRVVSVIPNPIVGLNLACAGCVIDIQPGGSLTLAGAGSIGNGATLKVSGGTLTIASGGALTFSSGALFEFTSGFVDVQTGGQMTLNGARTIGATLEVSGGTLTIPATASLALQSGLNLIGATVNGGGTINNTGSVQSAGTSTVNAVLNNSPGGNVNVNSGTLSLTAGGTGDAPFTIGSGATLGFPSGSYTMTTGGVVSGAGTLSVTGGTLSIGGVTTPGGFVLTAGTLTGPGFLSIVNNLTWSGGTLTGSGGTELAGSGIGNIDGANGATSPMVLDGRSFNNYGTIHYTATNPLQLSNGAAFTTYGSFFFEADGSITCNCAVPPSFNVFPNGVVGKNGGSLTSTINTPFTNSGANVFASSGTLELAGNSANSGLFFAAGAGATLKFSASSSTFDASSFITSDAAGTILFSAGSAVISGAYQVNGMTSIAGASVTFDAFGNGLNGFADTTDLSFTGGTLTLDKGLSLYRFGTWSGGTIKAICGCKQFFIDSGATLTIDAAFGVAKVNAAEILNDGTINYTAAANSFDLANGADIDNQGLFDIKSDQPITATVGGFIVEPGTKTASAVAKQTRRLKARTLNLKFGFGYRGTPLASASAFVGTIFNNGTLKKSAGTGTTLINPDLFNSATVLALNGTMSFTGPYKQNSGATTLGPGSIAVASPLTMTGGELNGTGTLTGDLDNTGGNVSPAGPSAVGTINVTGTYTQRSTGPGTLAIELASASSYDILAVGGTATLDGPLNTSLLGGYQPLNGTTFTPLTFASRSGDFAVKTPLTWAAGHGSMAYSYPIAGTSLLLTAVVTPPSADLGVAVSGQTTVNAGAPLSYGVTVTNNGPDPTSGTVTVANTLPAGATAASGSGSGWICGAPSGGVITCTSSATIANGGSFPLLTFSMTAPANGGSVSDSATVSSSFDTNATNNTNSLTTTIVAQADLAITKSGPTGVTAGQNIVYTIVVTNNGPSAATGVQVSDPQPANLTFVSNSGACTGAYPCNLGTLTSGQSVTITSTYSTSPTFSGNVTNVATVSETTADPNNSNNSISFTTNVGAQSDLSITKTGPPATNTGQNVVYTIIVNNAGPSPVTNAVVADPTPVGLAFQSNSGACTGQFPCNLGPLASGQSVTITSTYTVPGNYGGATIVNTASVSSSVNDPNTGNNSSTVTTNVAQQADVSITKTGPPSTSQGQNIVYTIIVSNSGPSGAAGVTVNDATPTGLTFVSNSGACTSAFPCNLGVLNASQSVTITATFNVPANYAGTSITNIATVSSAANDSNPGNNNSTVVTPVVAQADLSITKSGPASFTLGQNITYVVAVTNAGPLPATNTFVADPTPAGLTFVSNSGACAGPYPCALGSLASGQSVAITSVYNVPANYSGGSITNTATASSSSTDTNQGNNAAVATTPLGTGSTDLAISKSGPADVNPNSIVDFNIFVFNNGPSSGTGVVVNDPTPLGLSFVSNSGGCSTPFPCNIGTVLPRKLVTITARYTVQAAVGSTITNTASVTSSGIDTNASNNSDSVTTRVIAGIVCPQTPILTAPAGGATVTSPVAFSWSVASNASSYVVTITGAGSTQTFSTTSASITQALVNGSYSWSVQAVGSAGCPSSTSGSSTFSVCNAPGAPLASVVGLSATGQTYTVEWAPIDGATTYELQEAIEASFSDPTSTTLGGTSKSFTKNIQNATAFYYRVRAVAGCSLTPSPFSLTAPVVVVPLPALGALNPNVAVPSGSTQPVTFPIHVAGLPGLSTSFIATVDKPWLAVTPTSGIMPPEGVNFTIAADPSTLPNGTWTGTIIIIFGSTGVSGKQALDVAPKTSIPVSISLTTPVTPGTLSAPSATAVVIPSVGHLAGLSSQWQSDIRIANITALSKKVQLTFSAGSATSRAVKQTTISIDPGATTALDDIVRNWYGVGALGDSSNGVLTVQPLDFAGKPDLSVSKATVASSRTFNASVAGTVGQFIPAVPLANFISSAPGASTILALQQIAQSDTFRTNLGLVEATGKQASVLVSIFNGGGSRLLDIPLTLAGGEQRQLNSFLANNGISLTNGHIEVQATGGEGKVTAYASVIDDRTTDPLLVSGVPLGGVGASRFVIPGVASLDTAATWRSDVRIFNGSLTPQTTTLTLFPTGNPSASVSSVVTIQPGEVKALDDIVHSTFNLTNAGGALHVTTAISVPLVVTARTYDDTPNGTLGQFVQAVTAADAVGSGERSLQLLQMEDSPRYRTNLGLAEVTGKSVTAEVTVILPDSKVSPKVQIPLAAFEYRQFPIISALGLGNTYNARISVRVIDGQGKITACGSVIDQKTQDPTFVPAQ